MRLPCFSLPLAVLVLATSGAALAQRRQLQEFQAEEMTQQERDAALARSKYNINPYSKDIQPREDPVPWKALGLACIAFAVTAPFAWRVYKGTTREMAEAHVFGVSNAHTGEAEDDPH